MTMFVDDKLPVTTGSEQAPTEQDVADESIAAIQELTLFDQRASQELSLTKTTIMANIPWLRDCLREHLPARIAVVAEATALGITLACTGRAAVTKTRKRYRQAIAASRCLLNSRSPSSKYGDSSVLV